MKFREITKKNNKKKCYFENLLKKLVSTDAIVKISNG
jgi:hypothetical protein